MSDCKHESDLDGYCADCGVSFAHLHGELEDRIAVLEAELTQERKDFHEAWDMYQAAKAKLDAIEANIRSWDEHSTTGLESFVVNSFRAALGEAK